MSGSRRIGSQVHLVVRWEDAPGSAWLEALVSVDLNANDAAPRALAVVPGISFSNSKVSNNLFTLGQKLAMLVHTGPEWGLWTYDPRTEGSSLQKLGEGIKYAAAVSPELGVFVEKTDYGTYAAGTVDLPSGTRSDAAESSTLWKVLEGSGPPVAASTADDGSRQLVNLLSGAAFKLPDDANVRRAGADIIVWQAGPRPTRAWLYDPVSWKPLAWWRSTTSR